MAHTLLLADDSITIQRVIELTFADEDIKVVAVGDGEKAIAQIDAAPPDIVLADIGMPGKNGYEVAEHIKQSPLLSHIPVVLLTGAFEPVDQDKAKSVGCDGVLAKPFEPQLVIGRVRELLARGGHDRAVNDAARAPVEARGASPWSAAVPGLMPTAKETPPEESPQTHNLDEYFDRLDAAFANFSTAPDAEPASSGAPPTPVGDAIDWYASQQGSTPSTDLPLSFGSPRSDFALPPVASASPAVASASGAAGPVAASSSALPSDAETLPPLADAFAALLEAEEQGTDPALPANWPVPGAAVANPPAIAADEVVEEVTRRVLDQLSDRVVRETVTGMVAGIVERLIHEEIERIKASIK